jgi:hypothetical protein
MAVGLALMLGLLLVTLMVLFHYEVLQFAAGLPDRLTFSTRPRVLIVLAVVLAGCALPGSKHFACNTHIAAPA